MKTAALALAACFLLAGCWQLSGEEEVVEEKVTHTLVCYDGANIITVADRLPLLRFHWGVGVYYGELPGGEPFTYPPGKGVLCFIESEVLDHAPEQEV